MVLFLSTGSPLQARHTFPLFPFLLSIVSLTLIILLIFLCLKKYDNYKKTDKYLEKEKNRPTTYRDVKNLSKYYHFTPEQTKILWEVCSITKCHNFAYLLKDIEQIYELFRAAYIIIRDEGASEQKLSIFFNLLYKIETITKQNNELKKTQALKPTSVVFYLNPKGEKFPFYVIRNTTEFFVLEIPEFLYNSEKRPKIMEPLRFVYQNDEGTAYNFVSRIIRYEQNEENQTMMFVAHTDKIISTVQRHYRRQYIEKKAKFSAIRINPNNKNNKDIFIYSDKFYEGDLSNISAGGCCIQTNLPIKEGQHLCIDLSELYISEKVVGIIKHTRKLPEGGYAMHIQFVKISPASKNKLYLLIYGFENAETLAN